MSDVQSEISIKIWLKLELKLNNWLKPSSIAYKANLGKENKALNTSKYFFIFIEIEVEQFCNNWKCLIEVESDLSDFQWKLARFVTYRQLNCYNDLAKYQNWILCFNKKPFNMLRLLQRINKFKNGIEIEAKEIEIKKFYYKSKIDWTRKEIIDW